MSLRRLPLLILAVAFLIVIGPALHAHPHAGTTTCAVCAAGVTQLPASVPTLAAPEVVVSVVTPQPLPHVAVSVAAPRASRAPPAS